MGQCIGIEKELSLQRNIYDMTPLHAHKFPIVCVSGPPGVGQNTQGGNISSKFGYEAVSVKKLLAEEAQRKTDRGRLVKEQLGLKKLVTDDIIIDLIKETMLRKAGVAKGFCIIGFPRTPKQVEMFQHEILSIDVAIYLTANFKVLMTRKRGDGDADVDKLTRHIYETRRDVSAAMRKLGAKCEKVIAEEGEVEVFKKIDNVIKSRISMTETKQNNTSIIT